MSKEEFVIYDLETEVIVKQLKIKDLNLLNEKDFFSSFVYSSFFNAFVLAGNLETIAMIDANNFELKDKIRIPNCKSISDLDISYDGMNIALCSETKLIYKNLLNNDEKVLTFQKNISKVKYLENSIVIGDFSGKLHFVDNINGKVRLNK